MKKFLLCLAAMMAGSGIAAANSVCVNTVIDVTVAQGGSFSCGNLVFSDFYLTNVTGGATGTLDIESVSIDTQGNVTLVENPNLSVGGSENLLFTVTGPLDGLSLAVGGTSATVTERACGGSISTSGNMADLCSNASLGSFLSPLGQLTVQSSDPMQQVAPGINTTGSIHIFQSISAGEGSNLGAIYQGIRDPLRFPPGVPEPITFVLLGSALAFLGIAGRRLRKN